MLLEMCSKINKTMTKNAEKALALTKYGESPSMYAHQLALNKWILFMCVYFCAHRLNKRIEQKKTALPLI